MDTFDLVVIGAGPGGYPAAIRAAQLGARTALVEREALGGTCLNWGCIPTKTLIAGADLFAHLRRAADYGLAAGALRADYAAMAARKNKVVATLRGGIEHLLKANGVTVLPGMASFESRNRIVVRATDGAPRAIEAKHVVIATGSVSAMPAFLPQHRRVVESRGFLGLDRLPERLIVLGGGIIGSEFACLAAQLGAQVTIVELLEDVLLTLDADVRREVRRHMETALGMKVLAGKPMTEIAADDAGVCGTVDGNVIAGDLLLAAIGRRPVTAELNLAAAGVRTNRPGFIEVDAYGQTTAAGIYAVGDVNGGPQLAHAATAQGLAVVESALTGKRQAFDQLVPACIFTAPEAAQVGLTEQRAKEQGREVRTGRFPFAALGRALAAGDSTGFVKWIADAKTDQLLGAAAVGAHATELIAEATLAIKAEWTAETLGRAIHSHPTFAEAWMEAAHAVHGTCIHAAPKRR